jgi:rubrerythrin
MGGADKRAGRGGHGTRDTASMKWRHILFGGGVFDVSGEHPNKKGWDIYELGQKSFWAVPTAVEWDRPVREDPEYAEAIAAMLAFLCPGEKAAVTGASYISTMVQSEEAKFYFAEQALEEAKHYDALRRLIPKITGRPMDPPSAWVRLLYSFGVIDKKDVAFMMGSINVIGEHLANQIFHQINHVAKDDTVKKLLALIGRDESRHIAAGQRFFPEVYGDFRKRRHEIMAKHMATTVILLLASYELVNPLRTLKIDLAEVMDAMYAHYQDVVSDLPPFPEAGLRDALLTMLRKETPKTIRRVASLTNEEGRIEIGKLIALCSRAIRSPRALRDLLAA